MVSALGENGAFINEWERMGLERGGSGEHIIRQ
jgi:hypothetical protein